MTPRLTPGRLGLTASGPAQPAGRSAESARRRAPGPRQQSESNLKELRPARGPVRSQPAARASAPGHLETTVTPMDNLNFWGLGINTMMVYT